MYVNCGTLLKVGSCDGLKNYFSNLDKMEVNDKDYREQWRELSRKIIENEKWDPDLVLNSLDGASPVKIRGLNQTCR